MAKLTGERMASFLTERAKTRASLVAKADQLMQEVKQIDAEVFQPLGRSADDFLTAKGTKKAAKNGGPRAKKGEQFDAILEALKANDGKLTTKEAIKVFADRGFRTSANAVLMRMNKKRLIQNAARGEWVKPPKKAAK